MMALDPMVFPSVHWIVCRWWQVYFELSFYNFMHFALGLLFQQYNYA
jgi:hypothetical protein